MVYPVLYLGKKGRTNQQAMKQGDLQLTSEEATKELATMKAMKLVMMTLPGNPCCPGLPWEALGEPRKGNHDGSWCEKPQCELLFEAEVRFSNATLVKQH